MAGLTPEGLTILRLPEVIDELRDKAREVWADTVPEGEVVNVEDNSAIGRQIGVVAPSGADLWEAIQEVYDAFNPNTASGIALDNITAIGGVTRIQPSATSAVCIVSGNTNINIPAGSKVSSSTTGAVYSNTTLSQLTKENARGIGVVPLVVSNNTVYTVSYKNATDLIATDIQITTPMSGTTLLSLLAQFQSAISSFHPELQTRQESNNILYIESVDPFQLFDYTSSANIGINKVSKPIVFVGEVAGPTEQPTGTINIISTPILGWDSVINPLDASPGSFIETDDQLRERFRNTKFDKATNVIEALYSAILTIPGVTDIRIYENDTNITDVLGVEGHSFLTIVDGGLSTSIAQEIWENKPIGIQSQGNTTVTILDSQGIPHDIKFSRPIPVTIYIEISLTTNSSFPPDGEDRIKTELINHLSSLRIGDDVIYSRLYTPINSVPGHQVNSLTIGTSPSPVGTSNITIDFDELAVTSSLAVTFI